MGGSFSAAVSMSEQALQQDAKSVKALWRMAQAKVELGNLQGALADLQWAAELSPDRQAFREELQQLRSKLLHQESPGSPVLLVSASRTSSQNPPGVEGHSAFGSWLPGVKANSRAMGMDEFQRKLADIMALVGEARSEQVANRATRRLGWSLAAVAVGAVAMLWLSGKKRK